MVSPSRDLLPTCSCPRERGFLFEFLEGSIFFQVLDIVG